MGRIELPPRLVDWSILVAVAIAVATGVVSLASGRPGDRPVFALHGAVGLTLVVLLFWKLRRVRRRVTRSRWNRAVAVSVLTTCLAVGALATGVLWALGGDFDALYWNALNVHVLLGILLVPALLAHLARRFRLPRAADFRGRRTALLSLGLVLGGVVAWRAQQALTTALGVRRRFTGSRPAGDPGAEFPATSWIADDPDPVDLDAWTLRVGGAVEREAAFAYGDLADVDEGRRALLDCTSGWYTVQEWRGVRVGDLLDAVEPAPDARWVRFTSVTGYRFSLPVEEARGALLATHAGGDPLSHGHGRPLRLVAPGRRGFQWVKWVESVEARTEPDPGQWLAIFTSWLKK